jgi:acyl phosphate:glycerol-3-phosphate acyltransferase
MGPMITSTMRLVRTIAFSPVAPRFAPAFIIFVVAAEFVPRASIVKSMVMASLRDLMMTAPIPPPCPSMIISFMFTFRQREDSSSGPVTALCSPIKKPLHGRPNPAMNHETRVGDHLRAEDSLSSTLLRIRTMSLHWTYIVLITYLLGSVPFGKIIARKVARIDITKHGSGNIGATNVAREVGTLWGLLTLILDLLKGFLPVFLLSHHLSATNPTNDWSIAAVSLAALLGHQFSVFEKFRGGKGVATALGVYLAVSPLSCLAALSIFVAVVVVWDIISLASMISAASMPILLALMGYPPPLIAATLVTAALIVSKHRDNIGRIRSGQERTWRNRTGHGSNSRSLSNSSSE